MAKKNFWMVRAGEGGRLIEDFLKNNVVAIGWNDLKDLSKIENREKLKENFRKAYPEASEGQVNNNVGQIFRFLKVLKEGDYVTTYDSAERVYRVGTIESAYQYQPELMEYDHIRSVKWEGRIARDGLSTKSKNSLGSTLSVFEVGDLPAKELLGKQPEIDDEIEEGETLDFIKDDFEARAIEFIKDKISQLDWEDLQDLVAGVLRGMGYKTIVSPKGPDQGKDIIASPDGLGLEDPKILIEVKHRKDKMGAPDIRSFLGGLRGNMKGIYVSTGGFSKEAKYEADRANFLTTLIDLDLLVNLITQYYDNFDMETRALIPLRKVYWPA